ncbi:hypothetical protein COO91_00269 [Nostoc flagelliforme CCNUN1]|uniref:Uncharacterized protein n=1 Tax=Nostoc flagelliforme CCNUN1 TaxID=2038116 RepID=A0A2K8SG87_9NOSO|nr:hypothetical protein COO91_00269 [Nostoc flagelliforme CCNUN1]
MNTAMTASKIHNFRQFCYLDKMPIKVVVNLTLRYTRER